MTRGKSNQGSTSGSEVEPQNAGSIGSRISLIRGKISQSDFAKSIDSHLSTIGQYERGQRTPVLDAITKICRRYNVSFEWLITGDGDMYSTESTSCGSAPTHSSPALDAPLLQKVITAVRDAASASGKTLSSSQEAEIITGVYEFSRILPPNTPIPTSAIHHFLKAIK